jgi:hypothetical protein
LADRYGIADRSDVVASIRAALAAAARHAIAPY